MSLSPFDNRPNDSVTDMKVRNFGTSKTKGKAEDFLNSYSIMVFDYDDFDRGIQKAIRDYNNRVDKVNSK